MIIILAGKKMMMMMIVANIDHVYNWIELFVSMYNNTIVTKNDLIIIKEELIT
ncbi:MAG TPA: hypothetical protein VFV86_12055 [Nitrososphaeraceae archaeon]|nr:hypothetical protein [Nitrososphaeraceae archaeon]